MGQSHPVSPDDNGASAERSDLALRTEARGERAISQLVVWSLVCALQKYILTYADFQKLRSGALGLISSDGRMSPTGRNAKRRSKRSEQRKNLWPIYGAMDRSGDAVPNRGLAAT